MPRTPPTSARRHYSLSALVARRAAREARRVRNGGPAAVGAIVAAHQATEATLAQSAVAEMLDEQAIESAADALLNSAAFITAVDTLEVMLEQVANDFEFDRLVESLVQDAGRAAESVAVTVRPNIGHVRYLNPPSCSRCTVLAGRVYRYSEGFLRHPGCDCVMIPTTVANPNFVQDPVDLMKAGQVTGLSKADRRAILDGADFGQVVNVRLRKAGLMQSGRVLARSGRPTPEGIYAMTSTRDEAVRLLAQFGFIR